MYEQLKYALSPSHLEKERGVGHLLGALTSNAEKKISGRVFYDNCEVRTRAIPDQRLKLAP
jgi:hypothetical protein